MERLRESGNSLAGSSLDSWSTGLQPKAREFPQYGKPQARLQTEKTVKLYRKPEYVRPRFNIFFPNGEFGASLL